MGSLAPDEVRGFVMISHHSVSTVQSR